MKFHILDEKENKLLGRKEVLAGIDFDGKTPTISEIHAEAGAHIKTDAKLIVVKKIMQKYGENKAKTTIYIYNSEKEMKNLEKDVRKVKRENKKKWLENRKKLSEEKKRNLEQKPAEEKKKLSEEKPAKEKLPEQAKSE